MRTVRLAMMCFLMASAMSGCNCSKSGDGQASETSAANAGEADMPSRGLIEEHEDGKIEWIVRPDGKVRALVTTTDGKPIAPPNIGGSLTVAGKKVDLEAQGEALGASIPKLGAELTDIAYSLTVRGKEWKGMIQVPSGGTEDLITEPSVKVAEGTRGPNGGVVDVVGDQRVELVMDEESGEVRVYLLDEKLNVIPVGDAEVTVGLVE